MLSPGEIRKFIQLKRSEIRREKDSAGLSPRGIVTAAIEANDSDDKESLTSRSESNSALLTRRNKDNEIVDRKKVSGADYQDGSARISIQRCGNKDDDKVSSLNLNKISKNGSDHILKSSLTDDDIIRILRKDKGLPINMLKTGEFSPNNPLVRKMEKSSNEAIKGDIFLGFGEYEERRKKLMKLRQIEYKQYLDQQADLRNKTSARTYKLPNQPNSRRSIADDRNSSHSLLNQRFVSVGVQTDVEEISSTYKSANYTTAEKELSPRLAEQTFGDGSTADWSLNLNRVNMATQKDSVSTSKNGTDENDKASNQNSRQFSPRERLMQDLRHTYMPTLFDLDTIKKRNIQAEEDAMAKRQTYQEELKKQIADQKKIKEERKAREKLLEEAETKRLEKQLLHLKEAQEKELEKQKELSIRSHRSNSTFTSERLKIQSEIDQEKKKVTRAKAVVLPKNGSVSKLPFYYPSVQKRTIGDKAPEEENRSSRPTFTTNIPENSKFAHKNAAQKIVPSKSDSSLIKLSKNLKDKTNYEPDFLGRDLSELLVRNENPLPIPLLKHKESETSDRFYPVDRDLSEDMKTVVNKWQVPAVQKNILRNDGSSNNILTQLGSIRKQLQLEQMRLDQTIMNNHKNSKSTIR